MCLRRAHEGDSGFRKGPGSGWGGGVVFCPCRGVFTFQVPLQRKHCSKQDLKYECKNFTLKLIMVQESDQRSTDFNSHNTK